MVTIVPSRFVVRDERLPLFVQVLTQPPLREVWSANISRDGMNLDYAGRVDAAALQGLQEGHDISVEFSLPDSGAKISARGYVAWMHENQDAGGTVGMRFTELGGAERLELTKYLSGHRIHVALCGGSEQDRALVEEALGVSVMLHHTSSLTQLSEVLAPGDISVVIVNAESEMIGLRMVDRINSSAGGGYIGTAADMRARIIYCGDAEPRTLVDLFNAGQLFRSVRSVRHKELASAVTDAIRDYGVRTEQGRATCALQRTRYREQAAMRAPLRELTDLAGEELFATGSLRPMIELARRAAPHKICVLLQGETGTGKKVLAKIIHELSDRANEVFVVQDCSSPSEAQLESELFGHETGNITGAFAGAVADHPGLFAIADGGTIFLDEIESTTPNMQAKLLRAIETGEVRPVGGTRARQVDVRVIAASNRDLAAAVRGGTFRADLFYRLNTFPLLVPALRERPVDILPLASHFLAQVSRAYGSTRNGFTPEAQEILRTHPWPGNIRELRNVIERAVLMSNAGDSIDITMLPVALHVPDPDPDGPDAPAGKPLKQRLARVEADLIRKALRRNSGVARRAAEELGMNPATLSRRMKQLGLRAR